MSQNSTELTFVRCPSCRSLVPAVSTRCRMCGATLDRLGGSAAGTPSGGQQSGTRSSGRVRQKTLAQNQNELSQAAQQIRKQPPVTSFEEDEQELQEGREHTEELQEEREEHSSSHHTHSYEEHTVPLQGDDEEVPEEPAEQSLDPLSEPQQDEEGPNPLAAFLVGGDEEEHEEEHKEDSEQETSPHLAPLSDEPEEEEERAALEAEDEYAELKTLSLDASSELSDDEIEDAQVEEVFSTSVEEDEISDAITEEISASAETETAEEDEDVSEESVTVATLEDEAEQLEEETSQLQALTSDEEEVSMPELSESTEQIEQITQLEQPEGGVMEVELNGTKSASVATVASAAVANATKSPAVPTGTAMKKEHSPGKLFGWLVSYVDPQGTALELREGKFFVTAQALKPSDLVIEDSTLSTPHCLVSVSQSAGFFVQDLMSERGVFVRHKGDKNYRREEESVEICHGDWVRFGDVEFFVVLISDTGV